MKLQAGPTRGGQSRAAQTPRIRKAEVGLQTCAAAMEHKAVDADLPGIFKDKAVNANVLRDGQCRVAVYIHTEGGDNVRGYDEKIGKSAPRHVEKDEEADDHDF